MVAPAGTRPVKVAEVILCGDVRRKSSADSCSMKPLPAGVEAVAIELVGMSLLYRTTSARAAAGQTGNPPRAAARRKTCGSLTGSPPFTGELFGVRSGGAPDLRCPRASRPGPRGASL